MTIFVLTELTDEQVKEITGQAVKVEARMLALHPDVDKYMIKILSVMAASHTYLTYLSLLERPKKRWWQW